MHLKQASCVDASRPRPARATLDRPPKVTHITGVTGQGSTSELHGLMQESPQNEATPFYPRSPYAVAQLYACWITVNYREAYGLCACNGIFNHGSPLRGETHARYFRPTEVETLLGDASKARSKLGWTPQIGLGALVEEMVESDYAAAQRDSLVRSAGFPAYDSHE